MNNHYELTTNEINRNVNQFILKGWRMVNARLCETARPGFFFASPRHFDVLCCESETLNRFECERETLRFQKFESLTYVS